MDVLLTNTALKPLLSLLVEPYIETNLTEEENAMIEESLAEHRADLSSLTPWTKVRKK